MHVFGVPLLPCNATGKYRVVRGSVPTTTNKVLPTLPGGRVGSGPTACLAAPRPEQMSRGQVLRVQSRFNPEEENMSPTSSLVASGETEAGESPWQYVDRKGHRDKRTLLFLRQWLIARSLDRSCLQTQSGEPIRNLCVGDSCTRTLRRPYHPGRRTRMYLKDAEEY